MMRLAPRSFATRIASRRRLGFTFTALASRAMGAPLVETAVQTFDDDAHAQGTSANSEHAVAKTVWNFVNVAVSCIVPVGG